MKDKIAIIGVSCRFPESENYQEFWNNLITEKDCISEIPADRWDIDSFYAENRRESLKSVSKWCGIVEDATYFDHEFFGISAREAKYIDPQQRICLEESWHCIEDSGVDIKELQKKKTGVFMGVMATDYKHILGINETDVDAFHAIGNYECILANRISHCLGLSGSSQSINAACASSIIAIHEAKKSLLLGEHEFALAGGVNLNLSPWKYISFSKAGMLSRTGRCKTFDRSADGYVPGDGVGIVLLTTLEKAVRNNYHIYGIVSGSATNHTGNGRGISAPKIDAQKQVIQEAIHNAGVQPTEIDYVEAHGTGTSLGDPIEIEALKQVFQQQGSIKNQSCPIGSVKTNIGHLESAAGVAGLIKVLMMFKYKTIPSLLHIKIPNPIINFEQSPFRIVKERETLQAKSETGLVAGVSSFGFGGSNSHMILKSYYEQSQPKTEKRETPSPVLLIISARSKEQVKQYKQRLKKHWEAQKSEYQHLPENEVLKRISRTLFSRKIQRYRAVTVANTLADYEQFLEDENTIHDGVKRKFRLHIGNVTNDKQSIKQYHKFYEKLVDAGIKISGISTHKEGIALAGIISGMIHIDTLDALQNPKEILEREIKVPKIPIRTLTGAQHWILPYSFDQQYLDALLQSLDLPLDIVRYFLDRSRLLFDYQYTFKNYLGEWDKVLAHKGKELSIEAMLKNDALLFSIDEEEKKNLRFLILVLATSLQRLNNRWDLKSEALDNDSYFKEFVDIIEDGVIAYDDVVSMVFDTDNEWSDIITRMKHNYDKIDSNKSYRFLKERTQQSIEKYRTIDTLFEDETIASDLICNDLYQTEEVHCIHIGKEASHQEDTPCTRIDIEHQSEGFLYDMKQLLQIGAEVPKNQLFGVEKIQPISLPGYPFKKVLHWIPPKFKNILEKVSPTSTERPTPIQEPPVIDKSGTTEAYQRAEDLLLKVLQKELDINREDLDTSADVADYGIDSVLSTIVMASLQEILPDLPRMLFVENETLDDVIQYLAQNYEESLLKHHQPVNDNHTKEIAIIQKSQISQEETTKNQEESLVRYSVKEQVESLLRQLFVKELKVPATDIDFEAEVSEFGVDSVVSNILIAELQESIPDIPQILFLENRNLNEVVRYIESNFGHYFEKKEITAVTEVPKNNTINSDTKNEESAQTNHNFQFAKTNNDEVESKDLAIIGISGILPKSNDITQFKQYLDQGVRLTEHIPEHRLNLLKATAEDKKAIASFYGGFIQNIEEFDYAAFGFSKEEAIQIDPQLRKLIEEVWKTIHNAGYKIKDFQKKETGVYVATRGNSGYSEIMNAAEKEYESEFPALYANRISHVFNLKGPSEVIDTGCSSFIAALERAYQAISMGDCQQAVVATATLNLSLSALQKKDFIGIYSKKNITKSFSNDSDGFVRSETIGAVVIKPLSQAEKNGDYIYGVIKGIGVYHGGKSPLKWNSPNIKGQKKSIEKAIEKANIDPVTIDYIETEANGTSFVDSSEIISIQSVYGSYFENDNPDYSDKKVFIGSLKPLVGHAETSSTFSCLIKLMLSLEKNKLYEVKELTEINKSINLQDHFSILNRDLKWDNAFTYKNPRRMAINCLGLGGVNTHLIFEEYDKNFKEFTKERKEVQLIFSDKSKKQLQQTISNYLTYIPYVQELVPEVALLSRMQYVLRIAREHHAYRLVVRTSTLLGLQEALLDWLQHGHSSHLSLGYTFNNQVSKEFSKDKIAKAIKENNEEELVKYWIEHGADINWNQLYTSGEEYKKIPLPPNTLKNSVCWPFTIPEIPNDQGNNRTVLNFKSINGVLAEDSKKKITSESEDNYEAVTFTINWEKEPCLLLDNVQEPEEHHIISIGFDMEKNPSFFASNVYVHVLDIETEEENILFETIAIRVFSDIKKLLSQKSNGNIGLQILVPSSLYEVFYGLTGLLLTVKKESTRIIPQMIFVDDTLSITSLFQKIQENSKIASKDTILKITESERWVLRRVQKDVSFENLNPKKTYNDHEVILITGGFGGLGILLARDILASTKNSIIILTGRSEISTEQQQLLNTLNTTTNRVVYKRSDISQKEEVQKLISSVKQQYKNITGIFHSAGVLRDSYILHKTDEEIKEVFASKVHGITYLDVYTQHEPLHFFVTFSSLHALGNAGQSDYAMANAFMDSFVEKRNRQVFDKQRFGKTLSINWPLWSEGGMRLPETLLQIMKKNNGAVPLPTKEGLRILHYALQQSVKRLIVDYGEMQRLKESHQIIESDMNVLT